MSDDSRRIELEGGKVLTLHPDPKPGSRGYTITHPPFEPGNQVALKHGAYQPRRFEPLALELVESTLTEAGREGGQTGYLLEASYRAALWAWARTEARVQLVSEWLIDRGAELDVDGEVLGAASLLNRLEARAESLRARLGLDPLSRARLGRDVASAQVDMAQLMARAGEEKDR